VSNAKNPCPQRFFGCATWNPMEIFFWASDCFCLCMKIIVIVHNEGNSAQMSFSSTHTKFPNQGQTNAFLTCANEHYAANLGSVSAQLRTQGCPSN
jgi:hypothetical protein